MERAFDTYVDQWMRVRDASLRPAQARLEANRQDGVARAAWLVARARAFASIESMERGMFDAMRSADLDERQRRTLDDLAMTRARQRARSVVVGTPVNLPAIPMPPDLPQNRRDAIEARRLAWARTATPLLERLASASLDPQGEARSRDLSRRIRVGQREAVRDIAALLPPEFAETCLARFRRQCMPMEIFHGGPFASSPSDVRARLEGRGGEQALARVDAWARERTALEEAMLDALLSEPMDNDGLRAMDERLAEMNRKFAGEVAELAGMPELAQPVDPQATIMLGAEDGMDLEAMADEGGIAIFGPGEGPDGGMPATGVVMVRDLPAGPGMEGSTMVAVQVTAVGHLAGDADGMSEERMQAALERGKAVAEAVTRGAMPMTEDPAGGIVGDLAMPGLAISRGTRPMSRQSIELLRTRLKVPESARATWDTLAGDVLERLGVWSRSAGSPQGDLPMPGPGETPEAFVKRLRDRREELASIEETWFDDVKAGVSLPDPAKLAMERQRRALERAREGMIGALPMPELTMSRWLRVDLDRAAAGVSDGAREKAAALLDTWRSRLLASLQSMHPLTDRAAVAQAGFMRSVLRGGENDRVEVDANVEISPDEVDGVMRAREPVAEACRAIEESQKASAESIHAALTGSDAVTFRRGVRRQTHPEAYRSQERVDAAFDRVLRLENLSPEQLQAVASLGEDYRERSERLVDLSVERTDRSDAITMEFMRAGTATSDATMARQMKAISSAQRQQADATFDREELNARALRRLRAALTPEQADAAKVD